MNAANQLSEDLLEFNFTAIRAGDIVFVYDQLPGLSNRIKRGLIVAGQRLLAATRRQDRLALKLRTEQYSHVMLGMDGGLIIHADGKTVAVELLDDALDMETDWASRFRVYRRKELNPAASEAIVSSAIRFFDKQYRFTTYFGQTQDKNTTQFCSRLVAHAYRAAGMPLASLEDHRVLPIDLFKICQSSEWQDVRSTFFQKPIAADVDKSLPSIEIPGEGTFAFSEFMKKTDDLLRDCAQIHKNFIRTQHEVTRELMKTEALLAQHAAALVARSKQLCLNPGIMEELDAARITRVLEQVNVLLTYSMMPSIELLLADNYLNSGDSAEGPYAGYPPPQTLRAMEKGRITRTCYAYLISAQIGIFTIIAHRTLDEKLEIYRSVPAHYADRFLAGLPAIGDLSSYENQTGLFPWIQSESDRNTSLQVFQATVQGLKAVDILRH